MKKRLLVKAVVCLLFLFPASNTFAGIKRWCNVQYEEEYGWSKEYKMQVEFVTGQELNTRTKSYKYHVYSKYCLLWFTDGGVAIEEIKDYFTCGNEFDDEAFQSLFGFKYSIICNQINTDKEEPVRWKITGKNYSGFIDPIDN